MGLTRRIADFIFGYDFFISYAHADGTNYAEDLANALHRRGYKVFLDLHVYRAGTDLRSATKRRVRMSTYFIILAGPYAMESDWVYREAEIAIASRRTPIVIDFGSAFSRTSVGHRLRSLLAERVYVSEPADVVRPQAAIVDALVDAFTAVRVEQMRFRVILAVALLFLVVAGAALRSWRIAVEERNQADRTKWLMFDREGTRYLIEEQDPARALPYLVQAYVEGSRETSLLLHLRRALASVDAQVQSKQVKTCCEVTDADQGFVVPNVEQAPKSAPPADAGSELENWRNDANTVILNHVADAVAALAGKFIAQQAGQVSVSADRILLGGATKTGVAYLWRIGDERANRLEYDKGHAELTCGGTRLVVSLPSMVSVWGVEPNRKLAQIDEVDDEAVSGNGQILATVHRQYVRLWDLQSGALMWELNMGAPVTKISLDADAERLGVLVSPRLARIVDWDGHVVAEWSSSSDWENIVLNGSGNAALLSTANAGSVFVVGGRDSAAHVPSADGQFSPQGTSLAYHNGDGVEIVSVPGGALQAAIGQPGRTLGVVFNGAGDQLLVWDDSGARIYDPQTGGLLGTLLAAHHTASVAFVGQYVVLGSPDGQIEVFDPARILPRRIAASGLLDESAFCGESRMWISRVDGTTDLFDTTSGARLGSLRAGRGNPQMTACDPEGNLLATWQDDGFVRLWRPHDGSFVAVSRETIAPRKLEAAATGRVLAIGPRSVILDGKDLHIIAEVYSDGEYGNFSRNGQRAIICGKGDCSIVDAIRGTKLTQLRKVRRGWLNNDGMKALFIGADDKFHLWETTGPMHIATLGTEALLPINAAFSPVGDVLATAADATFGTNPLVKFWDTKTGRALGQTPGALPFFESHAFTADGDRLVTISNNTTNLVESPSGHILFSWSVKSMDTFAQPNLSGRQVMTRPNGKYAGVQIWDAAVEQRPVEVVRRLLDTRARWRLQEATLIAAEQSE